MSELFANVLSSDDGTITTLAATVSSTGATTITTAAAAPAALQGGQFRVRVGTELMLVTAGQSGTSWTVTRGVEGSAAATHASGSSVRHVLTASSLVAAQGGRGLPANVLTKTANFTAAAGDFILANATGGAFQVTLPAGAAGDLITVKKTDGTANAVAVDVTAGGTIDGDAAGASITSQQFGAVFECSSGGVWQIVGVTSAGGANGADGATGAAGADGKTVLTTSGAPSSGTGSNGDFAYDPTAKIMYGPKASGTWPSGVSLAGTNGTNGILATFKDEGSAVTARDTIDVQGNGAALSQDGTKLILAVPGGDPRALTGATAATRFVGGTTTGAPSTGTFAVGDFVIARDGAIWICTSLGTPGTWTQVSGGGASGDFRDEYVELHGLLGANYDPMHWSGSEAVPGGYELYFRVMLRKAQQIANLHVYCYADGASNTYGRMGVYSSTGTLLGRTATLANMTAGFKTLALTAESGQSLPTGGSGVWIRVGMLWTGGTSPTLAKDSNAALAEAMSVNLSGTSARFSAGSGGSAALPSTDPGGSATTRTYWVGVS